MNRANSPWRVKRKPVYNPGPSKCADEKASRSAAAVAVDTMIAARPLKPPPMPQWSDTRSAAKLALEAEIREGLYTP